MRADVVDIYHGDTVESFHDMAESGVKAVIAKVSQGSLYRDPSFRRFEDRVGTMDGALLFGAYHFGGSNKGEVEASNFLNLILPGTLMVLDLERNPSSQMSVYDAENFVDTCHGRTGKYPLLYYGEWLLEQESQGVIADISSLRKCPSWIARYGATCPTPIKSSDLVLWQFTGDGVGPEPHTVHGIKANCDISQWIGTVMDIPAFWEKHSR